MGFANNINYIEAMSVYPCALPGPLVLIKTAFEAFTPILMELESFSCIDILKLRAGISYRCGKTLKAAIKKAHGPKVIDRVHFLYQFAAPVERLLWRFFIADLASSYFAHWTSLIYEVQNCQHGGDDCKWSGTAGIGNFYAAGAAHDIGYLMHRDAGTCITPVPGGFCVPPGWYYQAHNTLHVRPLFTGGNPSLELWLRRIGASVPDPEHNLYPAAGPDEENHGSFEHTGHNRSPRRERCFQWMAKTSEHAMTTGGSCAFQISPQPILDTAQVGVGCFNRDPRRTHPV